MKPLARFEITTRQYLQSGLLLTAVWFLPSFSYVANSNEPLWRRAIALPITIALFATVNLALILQVVVTQWLYRLRGKVPELATAIVCIHAFLAGAIGGALTYPIRNWPSRDHLSLMMQSLHDGLFTVTWFPITVITLHRLARLKEKRRLLTRDIESLVQIEEAASGVLDQIRISFESSIRNSLKVTALQAQQKLALAFSNEGEIPDHLPELIRDIATIDMRGLSHAMISDELKPAITERVASRAALRLRALGRVTRNSLEDFALRDRLWILAVLMLGTFFQNIVGSLPLGLTFEIVLAHTTGVIAILALFRVAFTHLQKWILALVVANVISLVIFNDLLISHFHSRVIGVLPRGFWAHHHFLIASVTLFSVTARFLFLFVLNQSKAKYEALHYEMTRRKAEHEIHHGEYSLLAYKWAKHIHGRVQSQLISAAERLEQSRNLGDLQGFNEALIEVGELLTRADQGIENEGCSLHEELEHRSALWAGLIDISGAIDPQIPEPDPSLVRIIGEVTEEAFANALRHGKASEISYEITLVDDQNIKVIVSDNGVGPLPKRKTLSGLGTKLYTRASQSRYALRRDYDNERTILEIFFSINRSSTTLL